MAWTSGSVTGHRNLLDALVTFLTTNATLVAANQNWVLNKGETVSSYNMNIQSGSQTYGTDFKDAYLVGPGLAQQDQIYSQIRAYEIPASSVIGWMVCGATGFDTNEVWEDQPGFSYTGARIINFMPLVDSLIEYWIVANGRRWILVCKISGDFFTIYNGLLLPYALPSEYPYPMFVSGTSSSINELVSSTGLSSCFRADKDTACLLRNVDNTWHKIADSPRPIYTSEQFGIHPWCNIGFSAWITCGNVDGTFPLFPAIAYAGGTTQPADKNVYGELEGVYFIPGLAASGQTSPVAEDTITVGSDTYLVVQNCDRTDKDNYAAIKLE